MSYGLGVDLGTSFTGAAVNRSGHSRMVSLGEQSVLMPSIVRVEPDGSLLAGEGGPRPVDDDPSRIGRDFKRRLGDPTPLVLGGQPHSAVSLLAATLKSVVEMVTRLEGGPPARVVLTYPAVWGPYRREQFDEVPRRAGLDESIVTVLTEPEAAATHYAGRQRLSEGDVVGVYDLGGGTFDTTVTRMGATGMEILGVPEGVEWVGGVDFDEAVLAYADKAVGGGISALDPRSPAVATALQRIRDECIRAKEALSRENATNLVILLPHRTTQIRLTRADFEDMIRTPLKSTLGALHRTLDSAGTQPAALAGVLLVGGSSRIPLVSRMLSEDLGRPVLVDPHPQHCVALGAADIAGARIAAGPQTTATSGPPGGGSTSRRRRRVIATAAAAALLVGGVALVARTTPSTPNSEPTPTTNLIGVASTTRVATPTPSSTRHARTITLTPSPLALPITAQVLGLSARCLDVANALSTNGPQVELFGCDGSPAQQWTLAKDNTFRALGKCMDVGPTATEGAAGGAPQIRLESCDHSREQRWVFDRGAVLNQQSKLCLDVVGRTPVDRAPLTIDSCRHDEDSQFWSLPPAPASSVQAAASLGSPHVAMTIHGLGRRPQGVAVSPDGTRAYVPNVVANTLSVINTGTGRVVRTIQMPTAPQYVAAAPDGRRLYVTLNDPTLATNSVQVVDVLTGKLLNRIKVGKTLFMPAVSPDGLLLLVPDHNLSQISVIDTSDYQVKARIVVAAAPHQVVFSPDGKHAYSSDHETGLMSVLDVAKNAETADVPVGKSPLALAVSPDGQQAAVADYDGKSVTMVDLSDNSVTETIPVGTHPQAVAFAPDGNHVYVADDGSDTLSVIDAQTGRVSSTVRIGAEPWSLAVTPDGRRTYVTNARSDTVTVLDTAH